MNKYQQKDFDECEALQEQGEDKECLGCSCNICIAQFNIEPTSREAFRVFIRHTLKYAMEDSEIQLTDEEIEKFSCGVEDDYTFYKELADFLSEYIVDFGENYGLEIWER